MHTFAIIGLIVSILAFFTTKPVSEFLGPKGPGFWAIPRTLLSVMWFVGGKFIAIIFALVFALILSWT